MMIEQAQLYVQDILDGSIDFEGQKLADLLNFGLLSFVGSVAFLVGYLTSNIYNILYTGLAGSVLTVLVIVPPWPIFRRDPVAWLKSTEGLTESVIIVEDGKNLTSNRSPSAGAVATGVDSRGVSKPRTRKR